MGIRAATACSTPKAAGAASNDNQAGAAEDNGAAENGNANAKTFNFRELASATKNFRQECLISEGGFGKVFKGTLQDGQVVIHLLHPFLASYGPILERIKPLPKTSAS